MEGDHRVVDAEREDVPPLLHDDGAGGVDAPAEIDAL